jgi:DNA-binding transcriptional regulator GbsR (MarR family)
MRRNKEADLAWSLFASHGLVLAFVANNPDATIREISDALGLTERQISRVLRELENGGMITVEKAGRRNCYAVNEDAAYNHPTLSHMKIRDLVRVMRMAKTEDKPAKKSVLVQAIAAVTAGATFAFGPAADAPVIPVI